MTAALLLAAMAQTAPAYPVEAVLAEYKAICGSYDGRSDDDPIERGIDMARELWRNAEAAGWARVVEAPWTVRQLNSSNYKLGEPERRDFRTLTRVKALDYKLALQYQSLGEEKFVVGELRTKIVAGRTLYFSTFAATNGSSGLVECRLIDPLGDGIYKSPISRQAVERMAGGKVARSKGVYGSTQFSWQGSRPFGALRVHFGFNGKDPYAPYGMMMVRSFYSQIIVTT